MSLLLYLYIDEKWPRMDGGLPIPWRLVGGRGGATEGVAKTLDELPKADLCEVVAPCGVAVLLEVEAPKSNVRLFRKNIRFALEDYLVADPESLHVVAGSLTADNHIPAVVVGRSWIAETLRLLANVNIHPVSMIVETLAAPLSNGSVSVVWDGNGGFARLGKYSATPLDGEGNDPPAALALSIKKMAAEGKAPDGVNVFLRGDAEPPDTAKWEEYLGLPVNMKGRFDLDEKTTGDAREMDLLQGEFASTGGMKKVFPRLKITLALLAILALIQAGGVFGRWYTLKRESKNLDAQITMTYKSAFPEAMVVEDAKLQMTRNLDDLRWAAGTSDSGDFTKLAGEALAAFPENAKLKEMSYAGGSLKVSMISDAKGTAEKMKTDLVNRGLKAVVEEEKDVAGGVEARLSVAAGDKNV